MSAIKKIEPGGRSFSPKDFSEGELAVACLMHRIATLPQESVADLAALAPELAKCDNAETFREIVDTLREILFPELIGDICDGAAGPFRDAGNLQLRMNWIGEKVKAKREAAGLTQVELAEKARLPQSHISRIESGKHSPSHKTITKLANALGIEEKDLDYL